MTRLIFILTLFVLTSHSQKTYDKTPQLLNNHFKDTEIKVIKANFPLYLSRLDYSNKNKTTVPQIVKDKIQNTILDYYFNICAGDSSETVLSIKDIYFNSVRLLANTLTVYIIIFKFFENANCKILLYDNNSKTFNDNIIDFNLSGSYEIENGKLQPTNLKKLFKINTPEIEFSDFDHNRIQQLKLTRLYHNGTANAIETTILKISKNKIDTLDFKQKWVGPGTENP